MSVLCKEFPSDFDNLANKRSFVIKGTPIEGTPGSKFYEPIGNTGFFVNLNFSADQTVANIIALLDECGMDYDKVVISYRH